jgi:hypothetical protein
MGGLIWSLDVQIDEVQALERLIEGKRGGKLGKGKICPGQDETVLMIPA